MSKRGVHFAEKDIEEMQTDEPASGRLKAHSLDSDEENDEDEDGRSFDDRNVLREEDLDGQEEATIDFDEGIKITPFNLKEEMEEGYFDAEGNYFERKEEVIRDEWLDSLDWIKIKQQGGKMKSTGRDIDDSDFEDAEEPADEINCIKEILEIVLPGETVLKALRRLGGKDGGRGKSSSASARWQPKAKKVKANESNDDGVTEEDKQRLLKLTELADGLLQRGQFSIYQDTYEKLVVKVKNMEKVKQEADEDDALEAAFRQGDSEGEDAPTSPQAEISEKEAEDEVHWQYKWENTTNAPVYGPYSSTYMLIWEQQGCFGDGVWVKRVGEDDGPFYNSRRIDFELYT